MEKGSSSERPPAAAGMFYERDAAVLRTEIAGYFAAANVMPSIDPFGIIVPHAGYIYSAPVAAYAYAAVAAIHVDAAVIIGRSHHAVYNGAALDTSSGNRTPLGVVPVDRDIAGYLRGRPGIIEQQEAIAREHAIEVNLPFLQALYPKASIVPLLLGTDKAAVLNDVAGAVAALRSAFPEKRILIVCSTDLSHYKTYAQAKRIDARFSAALAAFDIDALTQGLASGSMEACGGAAVLVTLMAARMAGASTVRVLDERSSGDTAGDKDRVVGYLSAVIE